MRAVATVTASCNSCGSFRATEIGRSRDYEFRTCDNEFIFVRCDHCSLVYLKNRPALSELATIYPAEYYRYNEFLGPFITKLRSYAQRTKIAPVRRHAPIGATVVDVGCGNGELLKILKKHGDASWRLVGVDFAPEACAYVEQLGLEAVRGRFEEICWTGAPPHVIVMNQVIEHVENPVAVVRRAFELLQVDGALIIETPSTDAWDARLFGNRYWGGWHCPRHWHLYDPSTLRAVLEREGFVVVETAFLPNPYTWLHTFQNVLAEHLGWRRIARLSSERVFPSLVVATCLDVVQRCVTGKTSNMRVVAKKR